MVTGTKMLRLVKDWRDHTPEALVHGISLQGLCGTRLLRDAAELRPGCDRAAAYAMERGELVEGLVFPHATHQEAPKLILLVATRLDHQAVPTLVDLGTAVGSLRTALLDLGFRTVAVAAFAEGVPHHEVLGVLLEALGDLEAQVLVSEGR